MTAKRLFLLHVLTLSTIGAHSDLKTGNFYASPLESVLPFELRNSHFYKEDNIFRSYVEAATKAKNEDYRLPKNLDADLYELNLTIPKEIFQNEQSNEFSGFLKFIFTVREDTSEIKLHGNKLKIEEVTLEEVIPNSPKIGLVGKSYDSDPETDIITLKAASTLSKGKKYQLIFKYKGQVRSSSEMVGLYKSTYQDRNGNTKYLVLTQFEIIDARKVFPCLDEPSFKAQFEISITHPKDLTAVSNTPSQRQETGESATTSFAKTPKMSTYVVAMVVSEFTCTAGTNLDGNQKYEVCSRPKTAPAREYAVKIGPKLMKSLEDFTGIKYAKSMIGKMDQFAVPDFSQSGMENWGLCIYKEEILLWDPLESSTSNKLGCATIIVHEFTHQWFGNLVTPLWWSDTFLSEGFATYFQMFITNEVEVTWELDKEFVTGIQSNSMVRDGSFEAQALSYPAYTLTQLFNRFNTNNKGATIIRMASLIMEHENFKKALQKYLTDHQFSNTEPSDLLNALNQFVPRDRLPKGTNFQEVLKNWIEKPGFPLVTVKIEGSNLKLSQKRYLSSGKPSNDEKWYVPITLTTSSDTNKFQKTTPEKWLLPNEDLTMAIHNLNDDTKWIVLNNQQAGYYRVDYEDALWKRIETALKSDKFGGIGDINRAQMVDDIFNFVNVGKRDVAKLFEIFDYLKNEESYFVWERAFNAIDGIFRKTSALEVQEKLSSRVLEWMEKVYKSVPFAKAKDDDMIYSKKRVKVQQYACRFGKKECIQNAIEAFKICKENKGKVDKNLRSTIYCEGLRHSKTPKKDFDFLWSEYKNAKLATKKALILFAFGCTKDPDTIKKVFDLVVEDSSGFKPQDSAAIFFQIYTGNRENADIILDYIIKNHKKITSSHVPLEMLISSVANGFTSEKQIVKLRKFGNTDGLSESVKNAIELSAKGAESKLASDKKFEESLMKILDTNTTTPAPTTKSSNTRCSGQLELLICLLGCLLYLKFVK